MAFRDRINQCRGLPKYVFIQSDAASAPREKCERRTGSQRFGSLMIVVIRRRQGARRFKSSSPVLGPMDGWMACKKSLSLQNFGGKEALMLWLMGTIRHLINRLPSIYGLVLYRPAKNSTSSRLWWGKRSQSYRVVEARKMGLKMTGQCLSVWVFSRHLLHGVIARMSLINWVRCDGTGDEWAAKWLGVNLRRFIIVIVMGFVH